LIKAAFRLSLFAFRQNSARAYLANGE